MGGIHSECRSNCKPIWRIWNYSQLNQPIQITFLPNGNFTGTIKTNEYIDITGNVDTIKLDNFMDISWPSMKPGTYIIQDWVKNPVRYCGEAIPDTHDQAYRIKCAMGEETE
jgi:hypothetical protein